MGTPWTPERRAKFMKTITKKTAKKTAKTVDPVVQTTEKIKLRALGIELCQISRNNGNNVDAPVYEMSRKLKALANEYSTSMIHPSISIVLNSLAVELEAIGKKSMATTHEIGRIVVGEKLLISSEIENLLSLVPEGPLPVA